MYVTEFKDPEEKRYSVEDMNDTIMASPPDQMFHVMIHDTQFKAPHSYEASFHGGKSMSAQLREQGRIRNRKKTYITWNKQEFTPGDFNDRFKHHQMGDSRLIDYQIHSPKFKDPIPVIQINPKYNPDEPDMMTFLQQSNDFMENRKNARETGRSRAMDAIKNAMRKAELKELRNPGDIEAIWPVTEKIDSIILEEKQNEHELKQREQRIRGSFPNHYHEVESILPKVGAFDKDMLDSASRFALADRVELAQDSIVNARDYNYWTEIYDHGNRKYSFIESEQPGGGDIVIAGGLDEENKKYFVKVDHGVGVHTAETKDQLLEKDKVREPEPAKPERREKEREEPSRSWRRNGQR